MSIREMGAIIDQSVNTENRPYGGLLVRAVASLIGTKRAPEGVLGCQQRWLVGNYYYPFLASPPHR